MRRAAHAVAVCAVLLLTGCSSGSGKSAPTAPATTPASSAPASPSVSAPATAAPTLSQGQSATIYDQSATQNPQGAFLKVTVDAVKTATSVVDHSIGSTSTPSAGKQYLFVQLTLNNVGSSPINPSDFSGVAGSSWVSGNKVSSPDLAVGVDASNVGLSSQDLNGLPALQPGQQATGTAVLEVVSGPGVLVLSGPNTDMLKIRVP